MTRKICLLVALCLVLVLAVSLPPAEAICFPCECVRCEASPNACCYGVGHGNVTCSTWAAQNCPI